MKDVFMLFTLLFDIDCLLVATILLSYDQKVHSLLLGRSKGN